MKTVITSNWRPLRRALCTLLIGIAALWAMPRSACAQLGYIGEYNATTGAAINANFIAGIGPSGLAVSGNNLFVGYPTTVGKYDATTGAAINANFITTKLDGAPYLLAVSGNNLFVLDNYNGGRVGKYDATTGAVINATSSPGG